MQIGDIYRFNPEFIDNHQYWRNGPNFPGYGPFRIIAIHKTSCDVQSIADGRIHKSWAADDPPHWGDFDPFLTAAYKANQSNE